MLRVDARIGGSSFFLIVMYEDEIWKDIPGYEGLYQVSNFGRIKGLPRYVSNDKGQILLKERILKGHKITKGYIQVEFPNKDKRVLKLIHVLVAQAFIPNPNNYPQVNHINGLKDDNRAENLEWVNNSMNQLHAYKLGLNRVTGRAGKPKRPIFLITKNGERLYFESIASARDFLGYKRSAPINRALNPNNINYTEIKGYRVEYV